MPHKYLEVNRVRPLDFIGISPSALLLPHLGRGGGGQVQAHLDTDEGGGRTSNPQTSKRSNNGLIFFLEPEVVHITAAVFRTTSDEALQRINWENLANQVCPETGVGMAPQPSLGPPSPCSPAWPLYTVYTVQQEWGHHSQHQLSRPGRSQGLLY